MFVFSIRDCETEYEEDIYAVAEEGKRWFLKSILDAIGITPDKKDVYDWEPGQLINKEFMGLIEHEPNQFVNRDGETVKTTQHKIIEAKSTEEIEAGVSWGPEEQ